MTTTSLALPLDGIGEFCKRWNIVRLEAFGSVLSRDEFTPQSDVDLLFTAGANFSRERVFGPWARNYMEDELASLLGRSVDLIERSRVEQMDNHFKREHILSSAVPIYEE